MDIAQFLTSADLFGIAPEIILTITALSVLTLEMFKVARSKIILMVASLGLLLAIIFVINTIIDERILFGGMLVLSRYSAFLDFLYIFIGINIFCLIK